MIQHTSQNISIVLIVKNKLVVLYKKMQEIKHGYFVESSPYLEDYAFFLFFANSALILKSLAESVDN